MWKKSEFLFHSLKQNVLYPNLSFQLFQLFGPIESFTFKLGYFHAFGKQKARKTFSLHMIYLWNKQCLSGPSNCIVANIKFEAETGARVYL